MDPQLQALLETGIVDLAWYEAQTGRTFADVEDAVVHYLAQGPIRRCSLHPLFEPELTDPQWKTRHDDPLLHFLAKGDFRAHPLFRDSELDGPVGDHAGERWLHWVRTADKDTPVPGQPHTWGQVRPALIAAARAWRHDEDLASPSSWGPQPDLLPDPRETPRDDGDPESADPEVAQQPEQREQPLVSVVITTVEGDDTALARTLDSLRAQHYTQWEAVVVGGPTAPRPDRDERVRVLEVAAGTSLNAARAHGQQAAAGRYAAFLRAGDELQPLHLHHVMAAVVDDGLAMAHGVVKQAGAELYRAFTGGYEHLLRGNGIDLAALVASADLLGSAVPFAADGDDRLGDEDTEAVLRLARAADPHLVGVLSLVRDVQAAGGGRADLLEQAVLARHLIDWHAVAESPEDQGSLSVVIPARHFNRALTRLAALSSDSVEVIVVGLRTRVQRCLAGGALAGWPVRFIDYPLTDNWALLGNLGIAAARGGTVLLVRQDARIDADLPGLLTAALQEPGVAAVQPLNRHLDDVIAGLGAGFPEQPARRRVVTPFPLLDGRGDADLPADDTLAVPAAWSAATAVRRADIAAVGGLTTALGNDYVETDLTARLATGGHGRTVCLASRRLAVDPADRFGFTSDPAWASAVLERTLPSLPGGTRELLAHGGLDIAGWHVEPLPGTQPQGHTSWAMTPRLTPRSPARVIDGLPSLRWTFDTAAPAGAGGDQWGDIHFAQSLARAMRDLGQVVSIDREQGRHRRSRGEDDVTLVLRGLHRVEPLPNQTSVLWVISHPDLVEEDEVKEFDLVFAASTPWAAARSSSWGVPIRPLLQCTDPHLFHPGRAAPDSGPRVAWVGKSRGVDRPMLRMALESGAEVEIYGSGWKPYLDEALITAEYLPNAQVGALYAAAGVVLNDHWADMQRDGFISNRLFDAVACGTRVLTDEVEGIEALFDGSVAVAEDLDDVRTILLDPTLSRFSPLARRLETAERVAREHSFEARARALVEAVAEHRQNT